MTVRLKSTNDGLRLFKVFSERYKGFVELMKDIETIDSLEKAATEAENAQLRALDELKQTQDKIALAKDTAARDSDNLVSNAQAKAKSLIAEAETKASAVLSKANVEATELKNEVKNRTEKLLRDATDQLNKLKAEIEQNKALLVDVRKELDATGIELDIKSKALADTTASIKKLHGSI